MALLKLFVLLVDSLIELICMYFCIELTLLFFSVLVALMSFFHQHGHTRFRLRLLCSFQFSVDLFLICLHPSLGFCFAKYILILLHCEFCVLTGTRVWFGKPS